MHHPNDRLIQIEIFSLIGAIVCIAIALIKGGIIFMLVALLLIFSSTLCNALMLWHTFQHVHAYKQFARAIALFLLICWMTLRL
ncbi:MAG TPA: hypothetical protein VK144_05575 [Bacillota bacterium]|nr:hypothetical protein [Bacillota bacterium]